MYIKRHVYSDNIAGGGSLLCNCLEFSLFENLGGTEKGGVRLLTKLSFWLFSSYVPVSM